MSKLQTRGSHPELYAVTPDGVFGTGIFPARRSKVDYLWKRTWLWSTRWKQCKWSLGL